MDAIIIAIGNLIAQIGLSGFFLVLIIVGLGYGFYKIGNVLIGLLGNTLSTFLEKFSEMVNSITELSKAENEASKISSEEHNKILVILSRIDNNTTPNKK